MDFVLGTILGTFLGAFFGFAIPRIFTAPRRARQSLRHIQWAWEDFDIHIDRTNALLNRELDQAKEALISRGVLRSGEAISLRDSIYLRYVGMTEDQWRKTCRTVDDIHAELGLLAKPWFNVNSQLVSEEGQDERIDDARIRLKETLESEWPEDVSR